MQSFKKTRRVLFILVQLCMLLLAVGCDTAKMDNALEQSKIEPEKATQWLQGIIGNLKPQKRIVLGYYENPWTGQDESTGSYPSMKAFAKSMSSVGPFWYKVGQDGSVESKENQKVYEEMRAAGLKVYPLVTNKREATDAILGDANIREKATDNLAQLVKEKNYDGINIDFELLAPEHRDNLSLFMETLYPKLKAMQKTVIISVFPQVGVHESVSGAYDYDRLSKNTDYIQIMTYDNHWSTSEPGPIAPIDWYEENIQYAVEHCGANKVLVGVGVYGYDWNAEKQGDTIFYPNAIVLADKKGVEIKYDETVQAPYFRYDDHEVWFENARSVAAKLHVIAKYKPAGIAVWRLGQEQPEVWQEIDKIFPKS